MITSGERQCWMTLVTTDGYVVGALVLAHSLRQTGTQRPIVCLCTDDLHGSSVEALKRVFDEVKIVPRRDSGDSARLRLLGRPDLGCTFTKIEVWAQTEWDRVVFLDADMVAVQSADDLFERDELSACPDVGWPDCFNSGLFVCRPRGQTHAELLAMAQSHGSFDGGDQGLLNQYFSGWAHGPASHRIPFGYNLTFTHSYGYLPALKHFRSQVRMVHFIGAHKPWTFHRYADGQVAGRGEAHNSDQLEFIQLWWNHHDAVIKSVESLHPYFMSLYPSGLGSRSRSAVSHSSASFASPSSLASSTSSYSAGGHFPNKSVDFASYRVKWNDDVERYFQRKQANRTPHRRLVQESDEEIGSELSNLSIRSARS